MALREPKPVSNTSNILGVNNFAFADLSCMPSASLQARLTLVQNAIAARLVANQTTAEVVEEYTINGKTERRTGLEFLMMYETAIYRALRIQATEPDGLGIAQARLGPGGRGGIFRQGGFH